MHTDKTNQDSEDHRWKEEFKWLNLKFKNSKKKENKSNEEERNKKTQKVNKNYKDDDKIVKL